MGTTRVFLRGIGPLQTNITRFYVLPTASVQKQITASRQKSDGVVALDGNENFYVDRTSVSSSERAKLISFTDFENAFKVKTTSEIIRALAVYKICSFDFLVERNKEVASCLTVVFLCSACTVCITSPQLCLCYCLIERSSVNRPYLSVQYHSEN